MKIQSHTKMWTMNFTNVLTCRKMKSWSATIPAGMLQFHCSRCCRKFPILLTYPFSDSVTGKARCHVKDSCTCQSTTCVSIPTSLAARLLSKFDGLTSQNWQKQTVYSSLIQ